MWLWSLLEMLVIEQALELRVKCTMLSSLFIRVFCQTNKCTTDGEGLRSLSIWSTMIPFCVVMWRCALNFLEACIKQPFYLVWFSKLKFLSTWDFQRWCYNGVWCNTENINMITFNLLNAIVLCSHTNHSHMLIHTAEVHLKCDTSWSFV